MHEERPPGIVIQAGSLNHVRSVAEYVLLLNCLQMPTEVDSLPAHGTRGGLPHGARHPRRPHHSHPRRPRYGHRR